MGQTLKSRIKGALRSVTIWFNALVGAAIILLPDAATSLSGLQPYIPHNIFQWTMGIVVAANIILRFHTKLDLKDKS